MINRGVVRADTTMSGNLAIFGTLTARGWSLHSSEGIDCESVVSEAIRLGSLLGSRVPGRSRSLYEFIEPRTAEDAHPRSLSAVFGLGVLPFHTELSHRTTPCRYVLLGCIDPGLPAVATMLLDWRVLHLSNKELDLLRSAPVLVRAGRRSFYSTILAPNDLFLRFDPGCLEGADERGRMALKVIAARIADAPSEIHCWRQGDILIIDNWRILHGRCASDQACGRRHARILIDG